jgi:hypothetical protein
MMGTCIGRNGLVGFWIGSEVAPVPGRDALGKIIVGANSQPNDASPRWVVSSPIRLLGFLLNQQPLSVSRIPPSVCPNNPPFALRCVTFREAIFSNKQQLICFTYRWRNNALIIFGLARNCGCFQSNTVTRREA